MLFTTVEELQEFILWAKSEKILQIKVDGVEVTFSGLAFMADEDLITAGQPQVKGSEERDTSKTLVDDMDAYADEDLYYSSRS